MYFKIQLLYKEIKEVIFNLQAPKFLTKTVIKFNLVS